MTLRTRFEPQHVGGCLANATGLNESSSLLAREWWQDQLAEVAARGHAENPRRARCMLYIDLVILQGGTLTLTLDRGIISNYSYN